MKVVQSSIKILFFLALALAVCGCRQKQKEPTEEVEIKDISQAATTAFKKQDTETLVSFFTQDAQMVNFTTREAFSGREEIKNVFTNLFTSLDMARVKMRSVRIRMEGASKAVEKGIATVVFNGNAPEKVVWQATYIKNESAWQIQELSVYAIQQPYSHYKELKNLNWIVGSWEGAEKNSIDFHSKFKWDRHKNFLIERFRLSILDQKELIGHQIIGWDPVRKQIFSWVYDSDGGFGTSFWVQEGNCWYLQMVYTLQDGRIASALHVYTKVDENTYTFASLNRDIDGKVLPDIGPFVVVRKKKEG